MKAQGPKSIVSPEIVMLSVFITPWMKPTCSQRAISAACRVADGFVEREIGIVRRPSAPG